MRMNSGDLWRLGRRPGLDGLRGLSVLLVVLGHLRPRLEGLAVVGVTVFFALSGFLITSLLLQERATTGALSFRGFYVRRARRLLPALFPMLIAASVFEIGMGFNPTAQLVAVLFYVSNWASAYKAPMLLLTHTWSLAVEEQFYLLWPVALAFALRRRMTVSRLAGWCVAGAAVSVALRIGLWVGGVDHDFVYMSTFTRADALLLGCGLAAAFHAGWRPRLGPWVTAAGLAVPVVTAVLWTGDTGLRVVAPTGSALAAIPVLVGAVASPGWLTGRVLRWAGRRSYALYLWHFILIGPTIGDLWSLPLWAGLVLSFVAAELSWWLIERPVLRSSWGIRRPAGAYAAA